MSKIYVLHSHDDLLGRSKMVETVNKYLINMELDADLRVRLRVNKTILQ